MPAPPPGTTWPLAWRSGAAGTARRRSGDGWRSSSSSSPPAARSARRTSPRSISSRVSPTGLRSRCTTPGCDRSKRSCSSRATSSPSRIRRFGPRSRTSRAGSRHRSTSSHVTSPLTGASAVAADGHAALVDFQIAGDKTQATDRVDPILAAVAAAQARHPGLDIQQFGGASASKAINTVIGEDLAKAGELSLPVTLIILIVTFGTLVAAGLPLLIGITAVLAALGLVSIASGSTGRLQPAGRRPADRPRRRRRLLAVLPATRARGARRRAQRTLRAGAAAATSGRAVLISGVTVMVAMAGMFISGDKSFISFAEGAILVVAIAVFASLTVLPAMLSWLGDRVEKGRVPLIGRRRRPAGQSRFWTALIGRVMRRPGWSLVLAGGLLVALAIPALQMKIVTSGVDQLPQDLRSSHLRQGQGDLPDRGCRRDRRRRGRRRARQPDRRRHRRHAQGGRRAPRRSCPAPRSPTARTARVAQVDVPTRGSGNDAAVHPRPQRAA